MTVSITASGIALDGPLVAGEKVAVTVSGLALAAEDKPTLALLARFPDALLASVELTESDTPGTWAGELDTATKQTALFFATARADERRDAALELVAGRASLARLTVPMANSALCPKPDGSPFASPVYVPVPGPPGQGGDPYDQAPQMDGEASAGSADEYARGDHRHPTDTTRQAVISDLAAIRSGAEAGATAYHKPEDGIPSTDLASAVQTALTNARTPTAHASTHATGGSDAIAPGDIGAVKAGAISGESGRVVVSDGNGGVETSGAYLADFALVSSLAAVATSGAYSDLTGTPTIPAAPVQSNWNEADSSSLAYIQNKPTIPDVSGKADSASLAPAFSSSSTYAVGDYVTHEGLLYKCTTAVSTAGAWNASDWTAVAVTDEMGSGAEYYEIQYLQSTGTQYIDTGVTAGLGVRVVAEVEWDSLETNDQAFGSSRKYSGSYSNRWFVGVASDSTGYVSAGAASSYINPKTSAVAVTTGTRYTYDYTITASSATLLIDGNSAISQSGTFSFDVPFPIFAFARSASGTAENFSRIKLYSLKIYSGDTLVRDFVPVRSGFDGALLDKVNGTFFTNQGTGDFLLGQDVNPPVPTESPAFTGTPTAPTANAGTNTTQIATTAFVQDAVRYAFAAPTPTVSGTSATVACEDRTINDFTVATGITSLTITPPAAVTGRARDFFCRVTLTDSSLPTVTLSGGTIDIGSTEVAGMTQGVNLLMFTEIASGHWLASRRSAS